MARTILTDEIDHENYAIDGSNIKVHQDACKVKKEECLGEGATKIHALTGGLCRLCK